MHKSLKNHRGFTLVEVIIVIAIISIIASITIPSFIGYIDNSRDKSTRKSIEMLLDSVQTSCSYKRYKTAENISDEIVKSFKTSLPVDSAIDEPTIENSQTADGVTTKLDEKTKIHNLNSDGQNVDVNISITKESDTSFKVNLKAVCGAISISRVFSPAVRLDVTASEDPETPDPDPAPDPSPSSDISMESISDYMKSLFFKDGAVNTEILNALNADTNYSDGNSMKNKMGDTYNKVLTNIGWPSGDWWNLFDNYSHFTFKTGYFNRGTEAEKKTRLNNYTVLTFMNVFLQKYSDSLKIPSSFTVADSGTYKPYFYFKDISTRDLLEVDSDGNFVNLNDLIICAYNESNYFFTDESIWWQTNIKYIDGESFDSFAHLVYYPDKTDPVWYMLSDSEKGQKIDGIYDSYDKISSAINGGAVTKVEIN